jgi:hypothetical protein
MPGANEQNRDEVKALLAKANIEIFNALQRVDQMGDFELADARGRASGTVAFFDFNGSCADTSLGALDETLTRVASVGGGNQVAFFDFNGSCGGVNAGIELNEVQRRVLDAIRKPQ